jgi:hypothetical protein
MDHRAKLGELMRATVADEQKHRDWHYHAVRPCTVPASWRPGQVVSGDCSKGVQFLCKWAGVPHDPMDGGYGVYGNSQTLWLKLQHLDRASDLKVGDVVTFGRDGLEHAAMVAEAGADPLLWSFGHEGAPNFYRLSQDRRERSTSGSRCPTTCRRRRIACARAPGGSRGWRGSSGRATGRATARRTRRCARPSRR